MKVWMFVYSPCMCRSMVLLAHYQTEGMFILHISILSSTSGLKSNLQVGKLFVPSCTMKYWYETQIRLTLTHSSFHVGLNSYGMFSFIDWLFGLLQETRVCKLLHMGLPIYKA
jgi:hypothetical protein